MSAERPVPRRESPWGRPEGDTRQPKAHRCNDRAEDVVQNPRAQWTKQDLKVFCELYCSQIDMGTCKQGVMSKMGWEDIQTRFHAATGKLYNQEQFGYKYRDLKNLWGFIDKIRKTASGVGNREDMSIIAHDQWWEDKFGKNKDLKNGWPIFMNELERMFNGVAVTGETAFVPGVNRSQNFVSSGEEDAAHIDPEGTPTSFGTPEYVDTPDSSTPGSGGSKRSMSTFRSTGTSPSKKIRNTQARQKDSTSNNFNSHYVGRTQVLENIMNKRESLEQQSWIKRAEEIKAKEEAKLAREQTRREDEEKKAEQKRMEIQMITEAADDLGVATMEGNLYGGVIRICNAENLRMMFLSTKCAQSRLALIQEAAKMDIQPEVEPEPQVDPVGEDESDTDSSSSEDDYEEFREAQRNWWDTFMDMVLEDEGEEFMRMYGMYDYAQHVDKYCSRRPYRKPALSGQQWVTNTLADEACFEGPFKLFWQCMRSKPGEEPTEPYTYLQLDPPRRVEVNLEQTASES